MGVSAFLTGTGRRVRECSYVSIRFAFPPPTSYDSSQRELLRRAFQANPQLDLKHFFKPTPLPGAPGKYDLNNGGGLSTDFIGASDGWPNGSYAQRATIFNAHREYTLGLFHFLRTDPSVGSKLKDDIAAWGALSTIHSNASLSLTL